MNVVDHVSLSVTPFQDIKTHNKMILVQMMAARASKGVAKMSGR